VPEGLGPLARLVQAAGERVIVMPGGGVRSADITQILDVTGARELHASASTRALGVDGAADSPGTERAPDPSSGIRLGPADDDRAPRALTDVEEVRRMVAALRV
jgi:copper homeostasis protein